MGSSKEGIYSYSNFICYNTIIMYKSKTYSYINASFSEPAERRGGSPLYAVLMPSIPLKLGGPGESDCDDGSAFVNETTAPEGR
jgi:hypothetical protein